MRSSRSIALALATLVSLFAVAQTAAPQAAPPQTARQALIEMFFGQAPDHMEKHLPDITRRTFEKLGGANGQSGLAMFSLLAAQSKAGKNNFETFETGSTFFTVKEPPAGNYERMDVTVERDDFVGDKDEIEVVPHMIRDGKEDTLPFILHFTFAMKMESGIWRLNDVSVALQVPLADPTFLKSMEERQLRQNLKLLCRIVTVNIKRGIGLCEAFGLRLTERSVEADPIFGHARQDEIASAIENAAQTLNVVADEPIPQSPYDRNSPADAGFESKPHLASFRRLHQAEPIQSEERLVGGYNVFSAGERLLDKAAGRFNPANQLDHHVATILDNLLRMDG